MQQTVHNLSCFSPVIFHMSELQDHSELVRYSIAVLYICSAIAPPQEDLEKITELLIDATSSAVCI